MTRRERGQHTLGLIYHHSRPPERKVRVRVRFLEDILRGGYMDHPLQIVGQNVGGEVDEVGSDLLDQL